MGACRYWWKLVKQARTFFIFALIAVPAGVALLIFFALHWLEEHRMIPRKISFSWCEKSRRGGCRFRWAEGLNDSEREAPAFFHQTTRLD